MLQEKIKQQLNKFRTMPFQNHLVISIVLLVLSYLTGGAIGTVDGNGVFFTILTLFILIMVVGLAYPWIRFLQDADFKPNTAMLFGYANLLLISLLILLFRVTPYDTSSESDMFCYKLTTGETVCYDDDDIREETCKYVDCRTNMSWVKTTRLPSNENTLRL